MEQKSIVKDAPTATASETGLRTRHDLPVWSGRRKPAWRLEHRGVTRRSFLRTGAIAALTLNLQVLEIMGRRSTALAADTCSTSGLTYGNGCLGGSYHSTCTDGCPRDPAWDSSFFCLTNSFQSRHRTCGETKTSGSNTYNFKIRINECYDGVSDGWTWGSVDVGGFCGCPNSPQFSCNDGRGNINGGAYTKSICQIFRCI